MTLLICAVLGAAGVGLIAVSRALPAYIVPYAEARAAFEALCTVDGGPAARAHYMALFGWRYPLANAGVSLASASLTAGLLALLLRKSVRGSQPWLRTPAHRWAFVAIGIGAMLGHIPGIQHGLMTDHARQYFPWCADSMGIPFLGFLAALTALLPILVVAGVLVTLGFGTLPAPLDQWDARRPLRSWIVTLVFGAAMLGGTAIWAASLLSSDLISPSSVIILYLLASTRAALLAPKATPDTGLNLPTTA